MCVCSRGTGDGAPVVKVVMVVMVIDESRDTGNTGERRDNIP